MDTKTNVLTLLALVQEFVLPTPIAMSVLGSPEGFLSEAGAFELGIQFG